MGTFFGDVDSYREPLPVKPGFILSIFPQYSKTCDFWLEQYLFLSVTAPKKQYTSVCMKHLG